MRAKSINFWIQIKNCENFLTLKIVIIISCYWIYSSRLPADLRKGKELVFFVTEPKV